MSKFLLYFCAIFIIAAGSVHGKQLIWDSSTDVLGMKDKLINFLDRQKGIVNNLGKNFSLEILQINQKLREKAQSFAEDSRFFSTNGKVRFEIQKGLSDMFLNNLTSCNNIAVNYTKHGYDTIIKARHCLSNTVNNYKLDLTIINNSESLIKNLNFFMDEADNCVKNIINRRPTPEEGKCVQKLVSKCDKFIIFDVHNFFLKVDKIRQEYKISYLIPQLTKCVKLLEKEEENSLESIKEIQSCVNVQRR